MTEQNETDDAYAERLARTLRDGEQDLPPDVIERLTAARRAAVDAADEPVKLVWPRYAGAGALATAAVVVVLMTQPEVTPLPPLDAVELAAAQDAELLEDLEFAAWMIAMEEADEPSNSG